MIELTYEPINVSKVREQVLDPSCGAVVVFEGCVRNHHEGKKVKLLQYEAYPSMVLKVVKQIEEEARTHWEFGKAAVLHRLGSLDVGEVAVVVAVSSAHRKEAFEVCSFIMNELKHRAPIWKKETYQNGQSSWVGCSQEHESTGNGSTPLGRQVPSVRHQ